MQTNRFSTFVIRIATHQQHWPHCNKFYISVAMQIPILKSTPSDDERTTTSTDNSPFIFFVRVQFILSNIYAVAMWPKRECTHREIDIHYSRHICKKSTRHEINACSYSPCAHNNMNISRFILFESLHCCCWMPSSCCCCRFGLCSINSRRKGGSTAAST